MQRRFYKALCAAHPAAPLCAHQALRHTQQQLEGGKLQALQKTVHVQRPAATLKTMLRKCRCCKMGTLVTIDVFGKLGSPPHHFTGQQNAPDA